MFLRFWGKIIGKGKNYYVVESELLEEELLARRAAAVRSSHFAFACAELIYSSTFRQLFTLKLKLRLGF